MTLLIVDLYANVYEQQLSKTLSKNIRDAILIRPAVEIKHGETPRFSFERHGAVHPSVKVFGTESRETIDFAPRGFSRMTSSDLRAFFVSLDRVYLEPLSMFERELIVDNWLAGWATVLRQFDGSLKGALFASTPHFPWDLALSRVVQELGGRVFALHPSATNRTSLLAEIRGAEIVEFVELKNEAKRNPAEETKELPLERISYSQVQNDVLLGNRHLLKKRHKFKVMFPWLFVARTWIKIIRSPKWYWSLSLWKRVSSLVHWTRKRKRLLRSLKMVAIKAIPRGQYAYFALHFQPEKSTTPEAGDFWFMIRAIRELRAGLPEQINLVVGEHPRQIRSSEPDLRQLLFREADFYTRLASIRGVSVAHWTLTGSELIEGASLVATCTGSSSWEAMKRGKPSVVFGKTWYSEASFCINAAETDDISNEVRRLLAAEPGDVIDGLRHVVRFSEDNGIPAIPYGYQKKNRDPDAESLMGIEAGKMLGNFFTALGTPSLAPSEKNRE